MPPELRPLLFLWSKPIKRLQMLRGIQRRYGVVSSQESDSPIGKLLPVLDALLCHLEDARATTSRMARA
jgi:hypothetical protein